MVGDDKNVDKYVELATSVTEKSSATSDDNIVVVMGEEVSEELPILGSKDSNVATKGMAIEEVRDSDTCKGHLKATAFYFTALIFGSLFLFITFAQIYKSFAFQSYHAEPYVVDYSSTRPTPVHNSLATLGRFQTQGFGSAERPIVITLVGDSIVTQSVVYRDLEKKLLARLKASTPLHFKIVNRAQPSCTVQSMMQPRSIPLWVQDDQPHFLLILTNSDVSTSKAKWYGTTTWTRKVHRYQYELSNLTAYLDQHMERRWAFGGPSVLLEGMELMAPKRLQGFGRMSEQLYDLTAAHFKAKGANYLDFRRALTDIVPPWWPIYSMYATQDGEHYSDLGTQIMAENYAKFILN